MRQFNIEDATKMTKEEVMSIVCEGLAKVCEALAEKSDSKIQAIELQRDASTFTAFARFYEKQALIDAKGPSEEFLRIIRLVSI